MGVGIDFLIIKGYEFFVVVEFFWSQVGVCKL